MKHYRTVREFEHSIFAKNQGDAEELNMIFVLILSTQKYFLEF